MRNTCIIIEDNKVNEVQGELTDSIAKPIVIKKKGYFKQFFEEIEQGIQITPRD